jgi:hypothetical protein
LDLGAGSGVGDHLNEPLVECSGHNTVNGHVEVVAFTLPQLHACEMIRDEHKC